MIVLLDILVSRVMKVRLATSGGENTHAKRERE